MRRGDPHPTGMAMRNASREGKMFTETEAITLFPTMIWRHHVAPEVVARLKSTMGAKIDELLANRLPGTRHIAHQHPNNYLSGV